jgi:PAS domain S-box-containing protein
MTQRRYANSQAADLHAELVRRESQLRATLYGIGDAVIATDNSGRVTMLNPIAEKLTGWSETEAQGKPLEEIFRIVNEETRATVENPVARVVREGVVIGLASHTMLIARDGSEIPIADAGAPIWDAAGKVAGVVLVFRDQSAERAAQRAVHAAREFAESIIATVREPLVVLDADLRVVSANRAFYRVFQVTPAEIEGRLFYELGNRQWDIPALRRLLEDILPQNSHFDDYAVTHDFERIGTRTMLLNARRVHRADGKAELILLAIEDITERERTEQARRQSETRNRIISELVSDYAYIFRVTPEGELKGEWVTESFTKAFGLTLDGVRARGGWQGMVYPEDLAIARAHAQKVARGQTDVCDMRWVTVSGEVRWLRDYAKPILDETGRIAYIYGASQDITERKWAEETLRASEERYRALFENVPEIVYALAPDGRFTLLNPAFENITGWAAQDWLGQSFEELIHPDDRALARQEFQRALRGETRDFRELRLLAKSGETLVMEVLGVAQRQNGQVVGVTGFAHDITARKRAEEEAKRRVNELETVHKVSIALRAAQSVQEAAPILLNETLSSLQTDVGNVLLYAPPSDQLRVVASRGWLRELAETVFLANEGIVGAIFASGQPHISVEFAQDPLLRDVVRDRVPSGWGGVGVPIRAENAIIGVLLVAVKLPRVITSDEMNLLELLTEMAGTALHRLRLHDEALRRVQQLQTLQTIDRAIIAALDLRLTLNVLLEQSLSPLGVDAAGVLLLDPHSLMLEYAAGRGFRTRAYERSRLRLGEGLAGLAALEWRMIHIDDLYRCEPPFTRLALLTSEQFICYTAAPLVAKGQLLGVLEAFHRSPMTHSEDWLNFFQTIARQGAIAIDNARLFESLQRSNVELSLAYDVTIEGWARALDLRDRETTDHTRRVTEMTLRLARAAGMSEEELVHIRRGAFLHDIGKMGVPDAILLKPGPLTDEEWMIMRQHPQYAYDMLASIAYLRPALDIPYCHHEKWDGTGYPRGLTGEAIPLAARIFAVADVWDALTSNRPYRPAWSNEKAYEYIRAQAGKHFDPQVVELFIQMVDEIINKRK